MTCSSSLGGILKKSDFGKKLLNNQLDLPEDCLLPNSGTIFPHYFIGDEAFPMKRNLFRPYGGRNLSPDKEKFNTTLSKARRLIENCFGIMASRFRIFHTLIIAEPELAKSIIKSAVVLHNFIRQTKHKNNAVMVDELKTGNFEKISRMGSNNSMNDVLKLRDKLKDWINS